MSLLDGFRRSEASARGIILTVGAGVAAYMVGGLVSAGIAVRIADRGGIDSPWGAFVTGWVLQRTWLFWILPTIGLWLGRATSVGVRAFVVGSVLSGEVFGVLLSWAAGGLEVVVMDWTDGLARVTTLLVGAWLVHLGVREGRRRLEVMRPVAADRAALAPASGASAGSLAAPAGQERGGLPLPATVAAAGAVVASAPPSTEVQGATAGLALGAASGAPGVGVLGARDALPDDGPSPRGGTTADDGGPGAAHCSPPPGSSGDAPSAAQDQSASGRPTADADPGRGPGDGPSAHGHPGDGHPEDGPAASWARPVPPGPSGHQPEGPGMHGPASDVASGWDSGSGDGF